MTDKLDRLERHFKYLTKIQIEIRKNNKATLGYLTCKIPANTLSYFVKNNGTAQEPIREFKIDRDITIKDVELAYKDYRLKFNKKKLDSLNNIELHLRTQFASLKYKAKKYNNVFNLNITEFIDKFKEDKNYKVLYKEYKANNFHHRFKPMFNSNSTVGVYNLETIEFKQKKAPDYLCGRRTVRDSRSYKERSVKSINNDGITKEFMSISEAARETCINPVNIVQTLNGEHYKAGNLKSEYTDNKKRSRTY